MVEMYRSMSCSVMASLFFHFVNFLHSALMILCDIVAPVTLLAVVPKFGGCIIMNMKHGRSCRFLSAIGSCCRPDNVAMGDSMQKCARSFVRGFSAAWAAGPPCPAYRCSICSSGSSPSAVTAICASLFFASFALVLLLHLSQTTPQMLDGWWNKTLTLRWSVQTSGWLWFG